MSFGQQAPGQYPYQGGGFQGAPQGFPQQGHPTQGYPAQGYAPPPVPYPAPPQKRGGLVLFGITLLLYVLLELVLLISDIADAGPRMIGTIFGVGDHYAYGPAGFYSGDLGICVVLIVCAVAAFMGRGWCRYAAVPLIAVFTFGTVTGFVQQLTTHDRLGMFSSDWYTYLNLIGFAEVAVGLMIIVTGALVGRGTTAVAAQPLYGAPQPQQPHVQMPPVPVPPQQQPQDQPAHPQQAPQPQQPPYPPTAPQQAPQQPYGYGYPQPPAQPPAQPPTQPGS